MYSVRVNENSYDTYLATGIFHWAKGIFAAIREAKLEYNPMDYRMLWVGWDHKDHLVPISLLWTGTPSSRWHCSKPHPTCPGHFQQWDRKQKYCNRVQDTMIEELQKPIVLPNSLQYVASWLSFHFSLTSHFALNTKLLFSSNKSKFLCRFGQIL